VICIWHCVKWTDDHFCPGFTKINAHLTKICAKCDFFTLSFLDLDLRLVDLRITPPFSSIRSNIYENYTLSITFQYWVNERWGLWQTDKYHKNKKRHLRWWMYWTMCIMGRWSFWSCFDVTPSTADEDKREKPLLHFVPDDLDLWPLDLKFGTLVTRVQRYVFTRLEVSSSFLFRENMRYGTGGETDWRTDGRTYLVRPPERGHITTAKAVKRFQTQFITVALDTESKVISIKLYVRKRVHWL